MLPDKILQSDMLDIIFETRNKMYGAYALRREYNTRLYYSVAFTVLIALLFVLCTQIKHSKKNSLPYFVSDPVDISPVSLLRENPKPLAAERPAMPKPQAQTDFQNVVIVPDDTNIKALPTISDLDNTIISDIDAAGVPSNGGNTGAGSGNSSSALPATAALPPAESLPDILEYSQIMPQYAGGNDAFQKFMLRNLAQPDDLQPGEKVTVLVKFVVGKDGSISGIEILNSGRKDLEKEVLRVINRMPAWIPGKQNGQPVAVYFKLPVTFIGQE